MSYSAKPTKVLKTSFQFYNCAFHSLIPYICHFIDPKITKSNEFSFAEVSSTATQRRAFKQSKGYQYFLEAFSEYYDLGEQRHIQKHMLALLKEHANPRDLQVLLGSVLRLTLKKVLLDNSEHKDGLKESFKTLIERCDEKYSKQPRGFRQQGVEGKKQFLSNMRWRQNEEHEELFTPNIDIIAQLMGKNLSGDWSEQWEGAYNNYINYQCAPENQTFVSEAQLGMLCNSFGFDFAYTSSAIRLNKQKSFTHIPVDTGNPLTTVLAQNPSHAHWEMLAQNSQAQWDMNSAQALEQASFENYYQLSIKMLSENKSAEQIAEIQNKFSHQIKQYIVEGKAYSDSTFQAAVPQPNISPSFKTQSHPSRDKTTSSIPKEQARERHWSLLKLPNSNINPNMQVIAYHLDVALSSPRWEKISQLNGVKTLLAHFQSAYGKPASWQWADLAESLSKQTYPEDRQFVWFFPLSNYLEAISKNKKYSSHKAAIEKLCQELGLHVQAYQSPIALPEPMCKTQETPKLLGAHISQSNMIIPVLDRNGIWTLLTNNHQYASIYNNLMTHGHSQLHGQLEIRVESAKKILNKEDSSKHIGNIAQKIINGEKKYTLFSKVLASSEDKRLSYGMQNILESDNIVLITTAATLHPDVRNKLLLQPKKYAIALSILYKAESIMGRNFYINEWMRILDKIVPCVLRVEGDSSLHKAIRNKDETKVKELLQLGLEDPYDTNQYGNTALHLACYYGMVSAIEYMITKVLSEDRKKSWFQKLSNTGLNVDLKNCEGQTPLHLAAQNADPAVIETLLDRDKNPTNFTTTILDRNDLGQTALHVSAFKGHEKSIGSILNYVRNNSSRRMNFTGSITFEILKTQDNIGFTPLHYAMMRANSKEHIALMLEMGASPNVDANPLFAQNYTGSLNYLKNSYVTPKLLAAELGNCEAIFQIIKSEQHTLIIARGIKQKTFHDFENTQKYNAIGILALHGRIDLILAIERFYFDIDCFRSADTKGREPIHMAAIGGHLDTFNAIISHNKQLLQISDNEGYTPLHYASQHGHLKIVARIFEIIKEEQQTLESRRNSIRDSNYWFTKGYYRKKAAFSNFREGNIEVNGLTNNHETPYMLAIINNHPAIKEFLDDSPLVKKVGIEGYILSAIKEDGLVGMTPAEAQAHKAKEQYAVARIAARIGKTIKDKDGKPENKITDYVYQEPKNEKGIRPKGENDGNTFVHFCAMFGQYRYLKILLHALTQEERIEFCTRANSAGKTPLDIISESKQSLISAKEKMRLDSQIVAKASAALEKSKKEKAHVEKIKFLAGKVLRAHQQVAQSTRTHQMLSRAVSDDGDKVKRLLLSFAPSALTKAKAEMNLWGEAYYNYRWLTQDYKDEMRNTSGYSWSSKIMYGGPIIYNAVEAWVTQRYFFFVAQALLKYITKGDNARFTLEILNDYVIPEGKVLNISRRIEQELLPLINFIDNPTTAFATEVIAQSIYAYGNLLYPNNWHGKESNYIDELNVKGFFFGIGEGAYRQFVAPQLQNKLCEKTGIEWNKYTIRGALNYGVKALNDKFAVLTEINVNDYLKKVYIGIRTGCGVPMEGEVFDKEYADDLIEEWGIEDEALQQDMLTIAKVLFETSYQYRPEGIAQNQLDAITYYAKTGAAPSSIATLLAQAAILLDAHGMDAQGIIYNITTKSAYLENIELKDDGKQVFNEQLTADLSKIDFSDTDSAVDKISEAILKNHNDILAKDTQEKIENLNETSSTELAKELLNAQIENSEEGCYQTHNNVNIMLATISTGLILGDEEKLLDMFTSEEASGAENFVKIYMNSFAYNVFGFTDESMTQEHEKLFIEMLENALASENNETAHENSDDTNQESQDTLKTTVQILDSIFVDDFLKKTFTPPEDESNIGFDSDIIELLTKVNAPIIKDTCGDPVARQNAMFGFAGYLSGTGNGEEQAQYFSLLIDQAQTQGLEPSDTIKLVFENFGFVRITNLGDEFIEEQTNIFAEGVNHLNSPDNNLTILDLLNESTKAFVDEFIDVKIINGIEGFSIDDPILLNYIKVGATGLANNNINSPKQFYESMTHVLNLMIGGEITEDNIGTLNQLTEIVEAQSEDGTNVNDVLMRIFFCSPTYTSKNFSEEEKKVHEARFLEDLEGAETSNESLVSVFQTHSKNIQNEYIYNDAQAFVNENFLDKIMSDDAMVQDFFNIGIVELIAQTGGDPDTLNDYLSDVVDIMSRNTVTEDTLESFLKIRDILEEQGLESSSVLASLLTNLPLYKFLNFSEETIKKHQDLFTQILLQAKDNEDSLLDSLEKTFETIEADRIKSIPVQAVSADDAVAQATNKSVGEWNVNGIIYTDLQNTTNDYLLKLMPNATQEEQDAFYQKWDHYRGHRFGHMDEGYDKHVKIYNIIIGQMEEYAIGKLVDEAFINTPGLNEMHQKLPQEIMSLLQIPSDLQADIIPLFQFIIGRFNGEPQALKDWTIDLVSIVASPEHEMDFGIEVLIKTGKLVKDNPDFDWEEATVSAWLAICQLNGGKLNIPKDGVVAHFKDPDSRNVLKNLYIAMQPPKPFSEPTYSARINSENMSDSIWANKGDDVGIQALEQLQTSFPLFESFSEDLKHEIEVFCNVGKKRTLTNNMEILLTLYSIDEYIKEYDNGSKLDANTQAFLANYKPYYLQAAYIIQAVNELLENTEGYTALTDKEIINYAAKLTGCRSEKDAQNVTKEIFKSHADDGAENYLLDGKTYSEQVTDICKQAENFAKNNWSGTHPNSWRKMDEGIPQSGLTYNITHYGKKIFGTTLWDNIILPIIGNGFSFGGRSDGSLYAGLNGGTEFTFYDPNKIATPVFKINQSHDYFLNESQVFQTNSGDISAAVAAMPDYLRYPFGQQSEIYSWYAEDNEAIINGLLPAQFDASQLSYMVAPPPLIQQDNSEGENRSIEDRLSILGMQTKPSGGSLPISSLQTFRLDDVEYWNSLGAFDPLPFEEQDKQGSDFIDKTKSVGKGVIDSVVEGVAITTVGSNSHAGVLDYTLAYGTEFGLGLAANGNQSEYTAVEGAWVDNNGTLIFPQMEPVDNGRLPGQSIIPKSVYDFIYAYSIVKGIIPITEAFPAREPEEPWTHANPGQSAIYIPQYLAYTETNNSTASKFNTTTDIDLITRTHSISGRGSTRVVKGIIEDMRVNGFNPNYPIDVVISDERYYVVDGHHRLKAAKILGINDIPIKVIENMQAHSSSWNTIEEVVNDSFLCPPDKIRYK